MNDLQKKGSGPRLMPETRERLQIAKNRMHLPNADAAVNHAMDFWEKHWREYPEEVEFMNGGNDRNGSN